MPAIDITINYRPLRIGFLVKENCFEDLEKTFEINTLLWGGMYNPIIPIGRNNRFSEQLIKLFSVDLLYTVSEGDEVKDEILKYPYLRNPYSAEELFVEDWHSSTNKITYLDVLNIIDRYWENEFKYSNNSNCSYIEWDKDDDLNLLFTLFFGRYPTNLILKEDYPQNFIDGLKANIIKIGKQSSLPNTLVHQVTPLSLTQDRLSIFSDSFRNDSGLYIGKIDSFYDLVSFWNLRAAGLEIKFLPIDYQDRVQDFFREYVGVIDRRAKSHPKLEDWIGVHYACDEKIVKKSLSFLSPRKKYCFSHVSNIIWNGLNVKPSLPRFEPKQVMGIVDKKFGRSTIKIPLPDKPVLKEKRLRRSQILVSSISLSSEFDYPGYSLKIPFLPDLNEFYGRHISIDPDVFRVEQQGMGIIQHDHFEVVNVYPLSNQDLIIKVLERAGLNAEISNAGLLTTQIINQMGGLDKCRVFKIRGVRELLKNNSNVEAVFWQEATKIIWDYDFQKFQDLYIEKRKKKQLGTNDVWAFLLGKRVFVPKLKLRYHLLSKLKVVTKKFSCKNCGLASNIKIETFVGCWSCPFCSYQHYLPVFIGDIFRNELKKWYFKMGGIFSGDPNQKGSIPVILTLWQLDHKIGMIVGFGNNKCPLL